MIAVCAFAAWGAFLFMMSLYLQDERGFSAMHTGLIYLPVAVGALIFSPLSGRLVGRFGSRPSLLAAGTLITAATLMLTRLTATTPVWMLLIVFAVFGIGFSMVNAPITNAAVSGMPTDRAGAASAVASTSRQVGVSLGVALCGSVAGSALADGGGGLRRGRPAAVVGVRGTRGGDLRARPLLDVTARIALGRAACAVGRRTPGATRGRPCQRNPLADEVWRAMAAAVIDNRDGWRRAVIEQTGLPFSRIRILRRLARRPMTVKQVADAATIDAPAATVAVNDLEDRGLVVRETDPTNRRCKVVSLTDAGREMVQADRRGIDDPAPDALAALDDARAQGAEGDHRQAREIAFPVVNRALSQPWLLSRRDDCSGGDVVRCVRRRTAGRRPVLRRLRFARRHRGQLTPSTSK